MTTPPDLSTRRGALDYLLAEIGLALQLTETQVKRMESAYGAVAAWLEQPDSPLAIYSPVIYPQGSAAIGTTVRPRQRTVFDLDFVLEAAYFPGSPMELYGLLIKRLEAHGTYRDMIERKRRCVRLVYEGDFHADILGCRTALPIAIAGSVDVPDRTTPTVWKASNPRGYARWFENQSRTAAETRLLAKAQPLPDNWEASAKTVLQRIVQLTKRQRDMVFGDDDGGARSIVLTTLLATVYRGEDSVFDALCEALDAIVAAIHQARPRRIVVRNPMNPLEDFSEKWDEAPASYLEFATWIQNFRERFRALAHVEGLEEITRTLAVLFGEDVSMNAMHRYQKALAEARSANRIRVVGKSIVTGTSVGRPVPGNRNFGRDS